MSSRDELVSLIRAARANGLAMEEEAESILAAGWRPPLDRTEPVIPDGCLPSYEEGSVGD